MVGGWLLAVGNWRLAIGDWRLCGIEMNCGAGDILL